METTTSRPPSPRTDPMSSALVVALGWMLHGAWDAVLVHGDVVTWRWYVEARRALDLILGDALLALL